MKRLFFIIISVLILVALPSFGQKAIWKVDKSQFVPLDSNYNVSLLLSSKLSSYNQVDFYLLADDGLNLVGCELQTREWIKSLEFSKSNYPGYFGKSYKINLPLNIDDRDQSANSKLLLEINAPFIKRTEIAYAFELVDDQNNIIRVSSFDSETEFEILPLNQIEFYTDEIKDNKSLLIEPENRMTLKPQIRELYSDLLISYWAKIGNEDNFYTVLAERNLNEKLIQLKVGSDGFLNIPFENSTINLENIFVGKSGWNHFSILFNSADKMIEVLLNGKHSFSIPYFNVNYNQLELTFDNQGKHNITLDNIYIIDFGNSKSSIKRNINYSKFVSDSSKIIYLLNFENGISSDELANEAIKFSKKFEQSNIVKDNPPFFSRVPEILFQSFESFSEITWRNTDDLSVESYSLEKSLDGLRYIDLQAKDSENDPAKYYSVIDEKNKDDEIVYYRIRQLNKDGSQLFSAVLKVGQALTQSFVLEQNYPNPFNPVTKITIEVIVDSEFDLIVYDLVGNEINRVHSGYLSKGVHEFSFDATELPSGIYFMEASSQYSTQAIKMILAK